MWRFTFIFALLGLKSAVTAQSYLTADGTSDTYALLESFLGGNSLELPDCTHNVKHISQGNDGSLNRQVFYFHSHVNEDNDRCMNYDRQRTEITSYQSHLYTARMEKLSLSPGTSSWMPDFNLQPHSHTFISSKPWAVMKNYRLSQSRREKLHPVPSK